MGRFTFAPIDSMTHRPPLHHQVPLHKHNWPSPCSPTDVHQSSLEKTCLVRVFFFFIPECLHQVFCTFRCSRDENNVSYPSPKKCETQIRANITKRAKTFLCKGGKKPLQKSRWKHTKHEFRFSFFLYNTPAPTVANGIRFFSECAARVPVSFGGLGIEGVFARRRATICNPPQPFATVRNRSQPFAWGPYGRAYGDCCKKRLYFSRFQTSRNLASCGRRRCQGWVKWWQNANSMARVVFFEICWKLTTASHETSVLR